MKEFIKNLEFRKNRSRTIVDRRKFYREGIEMKV